MNKPLLYNPVVEENLSVLCIGLDEQNKKASSFMVIKFLPVSKSILICSIPKLCETTHGIKTTTLEKFYDYDGGYSAVSATNDLFGITIDRYAIFSSSAFVNLINSLGGIDYNLPANIANADLGLYLKSGNQVIDGARFVAISSYDKDGINEQIKLQNSMVAKLINDKFNVALSKKLPSLFNATINSIDSNISQYDFAFRLSALIYMLENKEVIVCDLSGFVDQEKDAFIVSDDSIKKIKDLWN